MGKQWFKWKFTKKKWLFNWNK